MRSYKLNYRINNQIRSPEVRVIGPDGKQIGVIKLKDALDRAQEEGLDLVEIAPNAKPPVAKIIELGKLKYEEQKKLSKEKRGVKGGETKEIRFSPFIAQGDYNTRLERIREFLDEKNKVRVVVKFGGRQMGSKEFGYNLLKRITESLGDTINVDMEPKFIGRHLTMVISRVSKVVKKEETENAKTKDKKDTN